MRVFVIPVVFLALILSSSAQFQCAVGLSCSLRLFDHHLPCTPSVRVSFAACNSPVTVPTYSFTGPPAPNFTIGVIPDISTLAASPTLHICYASNSVVDPNYSFTFGTISIIGPTSPVDVDCYLGTACGATVTGNLLNTIPAIVYFTDTLSCTSGPTPSTSNNLVNFPSLVSFTSPLFTYLPFGIPNPDSSAPTSLLLCWSARSELKESVPVELGTLRILGPTSVSKSVTVECFLGSLCSFPDTLIGPVPTSSIFRVPLNTNSGCNDPLMTSIQWSGFQASSTATWSSTTSTYVFGTSTAVTNLTVSNYPLCWSSSSATPPLVTAGRFTMRGPTSANSVWSCIAGIPCNITLTGSFNSITIKPLSLHSGSLCSDPIYTLPLLGTYVGTDSMDAIYEFSGISSPLPISAISVCWNTQILSGSLVVFGPESLPASPLTCALSRSCFIDLRTVFPTAADVISQELKLVESSTSDSDPCLSRAGVDVVYTSALARNSGNTTSFEIRSINFAIPSTGGVVRTVCWVPVVDGVDTRGVPVGLWTVVGPSGGNHVTCILGETSCVVDNLTPTFATEDILFIASDDSACRNSNTRSTFPTFRGLMFPSLIPNGGSVSLGIPLGIPNTYSLCYSSSLLYRRSAVIGSLTFVRPATLTVTPITCSVGSDCQIDVTTISPRTSADTITLSPDSGCAVVFSSPVAPTTTTSSSQSFTLSVGGGYVGTVFVCYNVGGDEARRIQIGSITVAGPAIPAAPATGGVTCVKGIRVCSVGLSVSGGPPVVGGFEIVPPGSTDCTVSQPMVDVAGSVGQSWVVAGSTLNATRGVAVTGSANSGTFPVCYGGGSVSVIIGVINIIGPFSQGVAATCLNGAECIITVPGLFGGPSFVSLIPNDGSLTSQLNACSTLVLTNVDAWTISTSWTLSFSTFKVVTTATTDIPNYIVCWTSLITNPTGAVAVPAGTLTLTGASSIGSSALTCTVDGSTDCIISIPISGLTSALPNSVAVLSSDSSCTDYADIKVTASSLTVPPLSTLNSMTSPIPTLATTSTLLEQTFNFGSLVSSTPTGSVSVCWSPVAGGGIASTRVNIGSIRLVRPRCDSRYFYQKTSTMSEIISGPTANCEISFVNGSSSASFTGSLLEFTLTQRSTGLATDEVLDFLLTRKVSATTGLVELPKFWLGERNSDGDSVLMVALRVGAGIELIRKMFNYNSEDIPIGHEELIAAGSDSVCSFLAQRVVSATISTGVFSTLASAGKTQCVEILRKGR